MIPTSDPVDSFGGDTLLTADTLAAQLGVPRKTLYRWASDHGLPVTRVGRSVLFRPELVRTWLDENTRSGEAK